MEVKICPNCDEHNHITAQSCKRCHHELISVDPKIPVDEPSQKKNNLVDGQLENQTVKEKSLLPTFVLPISLGFLGWFMCTSLFLGVVLVIVESMGPLGIILVPFTFVPILATILAIVLAFLIPRFRGGQVPVKIKGLASGIIAAYVLNFVMNLILNMGSDPLAIVGSILGWPFYMTWLDNLFGV